MKYLAYLLSITAVLIFTNCEGPEGPQGPPGFDGLNEQQEFTQIFDETNVNFVSTDNEIAVHSVSIPSDINVGRADVVAVYILNQTLTDDLDANVWEPLPRIFSDGSNGIIQYHFNFVDFEVGINDLEIVLEANDFSSLSEGFTDNVIFRIVIIPSVFADELNAGAKNLNGSKVIYEYKDVVKNAKFIE